MKNDPNADTNGTSFHDTVITTTIEKLRKLVGEPMYEQNDGSDKVNIEWNCITDDGRPFTIYDWKEYRSISETELIEFHIGGHTWMTTSDALEELIALGL